MSALPGQQQRLRVSKYLQGATMDVIDGFAALKFLITLKRKQEILNSIIISLARHSLTRTKRGESYSLSLSVFIVVVSLDLMVHIQKTQIVTRDVTLTI